MLQHFAVGLHGLGQILHDLHILNTSKIECVKFEIWLLGAMCRSTKRGGIIASLYGVPHCRRYLDGAGEMNRSQLESYLADTYSTQGEYLFTKDPSFLVFRHSGNKKWFSVIMDIPRKNLGLTGAGETQVVNLKCDTRLIGSFREEPGIFPGWHMNKAHWISVALDGTVEDEKIKFLVDMSYGLTKK